MCTLIYTIVQIQTVNSAWHAKKNEINWIHLVPVQMWKNTYDHKLGLRGEIETELLESRAK